MGLSKHQIFTFRNSEVDRYAEMTGWIPGGQSFYDDFGTTAVEEIAHDFLDHDWFKLQQGENPYLNEMRALGGAVPRYMMRWDVNVLQDERKLFEFDFENLLEGWCREDFQLETARAYRVPAAYQDYLEEVTVWIQDSWKKFVANNQYDFQDDEYGMIPLLKNKKGCRKLASYYIRGYMDAIQKWGEFHQSVNLLMELNRVAKMLQRAFEEMCVDRVAVRFMADPDTYEVRFKIQDPEIARQYEWCW